MRRNDLSKIIVLCSLSFPMFLSANPLALGLPELMTTSQKAISSSNGYQYPIPGIDAVVTAGQPISSEINFTVKVAAEPKTVVATVPEPGTSLLVGLGLLSVAYIGRRLRRRG